jgi:hypothetical protein
MYPAESRHRPHLGQWEVVHFERDGVRYAAAVREMPLEYEIGLIVPVPGSADEEWRVRDAAQEAYVAKVGGKS